MNAFLLILKLLSLYITLYLDEHKCYTKVCTVVTILYKSSTNTIKFVIFILPQCFPEDSWYRLQQTEIL